MSHEANYARFQKQSVHGFQYIAKNLVYLFDAINLVTSPVSPMAFIDDPEWVISHIRHCFITSDESGFCEHVLGKDEEWNRILNDDEASRKKRDQPPIYAYGAAEEGDGRFGGGCL